MSTTALDLATATASTSRARSGRLPLPTLLLYGIPSIGLSAPFFLIQFYFLNFASDVLLLAPGAVGIVLGGCRIWDAVSDPMAGFLSDRTRSRIGRRRPWMWFAAPAVAMAFIAVWTPPRELGGAVLVTWVALTLLAFFTAYTAWSIPHESLGAELSDDYHERSRIFGVRYVAALMGVSLAFVGMQLIANAEDPRAMARMLALGAAVAMTGILVVPAAFLRERPERRGRGARRPIGALRDVARNPHARRLLFVGFVEHIGMASQGTVAPFMTIYVLGRSDLIGVFPALFIFPLVLSVPLWIHLSRRYGKRRVWATAMAGGSVSYALLFFIQGDQLVIAGALLASAGFWTGCSGPLGPSTLADVIDFDEHRSGERKEGVYFAAWALVQKCGGALVVLLVGVSLQLAGFVPNEAQSPQADLAIRLLLSALPASMFAASALVLRGFALDEAAHARLRAEIQERGLD